MKNIMNRAHEIRREAATKWNCSVHEIIFSICLKMAWEESMVKKSKKIINLSVARKNAIEIEFFSKKAERKDISEKRRERAKKNLLEFYGSNPDLQGVNILFGDTYHKKEEIKKAGWRYHDGVWYSRIEENLDSVGFKVIMG